MDGFETAKKDVVVIVAGCKDADVEKNRLLKEGYKLKKAFEMKSMNGGCRVGLDKNGDVVNQEYGGEPGFIYELEREQKMQTNGILTINN